jgi:hypothetical protein
VCGRYKRKVRSFERDVDDFAETLTDIQNWKQCVNEVLQPIIEERMEKSELAFQEKMKVEEFYDLVEDDMLAGRLQDFNDFEC